MSTFIKLIKSERIICPKCYGTGKTQERISAYDIEEVLCSYCDGYRVVVENKIHYKIIED